MENVATLKNSHRAMVNLDIAHLTLANLFFFLFKHFMNVGLVLLGFISFILFLPPFDDKFSVVDHSGGCLFQIVWQIFWSPILVLLGPFYPQY